jgi:2-oxo-4-hydroxy-4-carboxy-5-ureidoimidazoline decarboxylase
MDPSSSISVPDSPAIEPLVPAASLAGLRRAQLAEALRPLWEEAGPLVPRLAGRTFATWSDVIDAAEDQIALMGDSERADLLRAHPRLGAAPGTLRYRSPASYVEQGSGRSLTGTTQDDLRGLNQRYEERFGFPCVEWVAGRPLAVLVPIIAARLQRDRATELSAGCAALMAIARDRLARFHPAEAARVCRPL